MGHLGKLTRQSYLSLQKRMDRFPTGIVDSKYLYEILKILFTDEEAKLCSVMPLCGFTVKEMSRIWKKPETEALKILNNLADKALTYDFEIDGIHYYMLALPILGFFEFSLMRTDGKFDRKRLSELYYQCINVEEDLIKQFLSVDTPMSRTFVYEDELKNITSEILPYEKARSIIDTATCITVGTCFCRHKMEHMGKACDNPQDVCLTFNKMAKYVAKYKIAREINKKEAHKILDLCIKKGLVQIGDNVKENVAIICNCCGCCCDLLLGYKRFNFHHAISPSSYISNIDNDLCSDCSVCLKKCPVDAISKNNNKYIVNKSSCLGCGVCSRFCVENACQMEVRPKKIFVPGKFLEATIFRATEQGKLGNILFDNQISRTHIIMRNIFNVLLSLPLIKLFILNKNSLSPIVKTILKYKNIIPY